MMTENRWRLPLRGQQRIDTTPEPNIDRGIVKKGAAIGRGPAPVNPPPPARATASMVLHARIVELESEVDALHSELGQVKKISESIERAMWMARNCLRLYLKYGDWDDHADYGTQAAFDAITDVLVPDV